jgi:hypothetical protein
MSDRVSDPSQLSISRLLEILEQTPASSPLFERAARLLDSHLVAPRPPIPELSPLGRERFLTIGMATYDGYDGVYFSIQAIWLYHPEIAADTQILVLDDSRTTGPIVALSMGMIYAAVI